MHRLVPIEARGSQAFVDALLRAWDDGDAVLPIDPRLPRAAAAELIAAMRPDDPVAPGDALVVATSGTTGTPKGVVLTMDAIKASAFATTRRLRVDPDRDRWLACLPLAHVGGLGVVTRAVLTSTPLLLHDGFSARAVERAARDDGATLVSLVATALRRVDAELFRTVVLGGSAPPRALPPNVVTTYGMTETGSGVVYDGVALDGVELRIAPETGEIGVRGPMLLRAYRDGADPKDDEGWLATGDIGSLDPDTGRLAVEGRAGDLIISGGENVWPVAVEAILTELDSVAEAAVVGRPDPEWGQRVVAVVVPADPAAPPTLDELRDAVKGRLGPWAAPKALELVTSLPRTSIGKVRRGQL